MIRNARGINDAKIIMHLLIMIAATVLLSLLLTACSSGSVDSSNSASGYPALDKSKIDYDIDMKDRKNYYATNVEVKVTDMSEEELNDYLINVNVDYIGNENISIENIIFLRSDNRLVGNIKSDQNFIRIKPGLYEIITSSQGSIGEMEALTPGKEIDLTIDYNSKSITYTENDKDADDSNSLKTATKDRYIAMKVYVVKTGKSELFFSSLRKAEKRGDDIRTIYLDIDSLPHEGCTREDLEWWSDAIDSWIIE